VRLRSNELQVPHQHYKFLIFKEYPCWTLTLFTKTYLFLFGHSMQGAKRYVYQLPMVPSKSKWAFH